MKIEINNEQKLSHIQEKFNKAFPYLKLEFFYHPCKKGNQFSRENQILQPGKKIGEIRTTHQTGSIHLDSSTKANMLEKQFLDYFGLYVQIFRKAGASWIETTSSGEYTLEELNTKGQELNKPVEEQNIPDDIHEQE